MSRTYRRTAQQNPDGHRPGQTRRYGPRAARTWASRQRYISPNGVVGWLGPDGNLRRQLISANPKHCPWCDLTRNDKCFVHLSYHE